jgi:hypothetical protein
VNGRGFNSHNLHFCRSWVDDMNFLVRKVCVRAEEAGTDTLLNLERAGDVLMWLGSAGVD